MKRIPSLVRESVAVSIFFNQAFSVVECFHRLFCYRLENLGLGVLLLNRVVGPSDVASMMEGCPAIRVHRIDISTAVIKDGMKRVCFVVIFR